MTVLCGVAVTGRFSRPTESDPDIVRTVVPLCIDSLPGPMEDERSIGESREIRELFEWTSTESVRCYSVEHGNVEGNVA